MGSVRKTQQLAALHPELQSQPVAHHHVDKVNSSQDLPEPLHEFQRNVRRVKFGDDFDMAAVVKAAQSFSGESNSEKIPLKLLTIAVESAGAQCGILLVERRRGFFVKAAVNLDENTGNIFASLPMNRYKELSQMSVQLAAETQAPLGKAESPVSLPESLIDPISLRELEVLKLMAAGQSNQEIAEQLGVVLGTVKNHINHIFSKLQVNNRVKAVSKAVQLSLL